MCEICEALTRKIKDRIGGVGFISLVIERLGLSMLVQKMNGVKITQFE